MTLRQRRRAKLIGNARTQEESLLAAGYSKSTARHQPPSVTKAKGWVKLLEKHLPDDELLTVTKEALKAKKIITSHTEPDREVEDHMVRLKAAEQGFKLKGRFVESNTVNNIQVNVQPILGGKTRE